MASTTPDLLSTIQNLKEIVTSTGATAVPGECFCSLGW